MQVRAHARMHARTHARTHARAHGEDILQVSGDSKPIDALVRQLVDKDDAVIRVLCEALTELCRSDDAIYQCLKVPLAYACMNMSLPDYTTVPRRCMHAVAHARTWV